MYVDEMCGTCTERFILYVTKLLYVRGVGVDRKVGEACLRNGPKRGKGKFSKLLSKTKSKKQKVICLQTVVLYNNCLLPC